MPSIEIKRKAVLSRQEVAERLIALGNALAEGSEVELSSGGDTIKIGVAGQVNWELEIEIDGDETEIEIELKWTDDQGKAKPGGAGPAQTPRAAEAEAARSENAAAEPAATPARRGRPRKAATG